MRMLRLLRLGAIVCATAGCSQEQRPVQAEADGPEWGTDVPMIVEGERVLAVDSLPVVAVIAGEGPGYILAQPRSGLLTRDGRLIVIEASDASVLWFSEEGRLVKRFGRRGGGPAEFQSPESLALYGDSIVVWDPALARLTLIGDEAIGRTVPVRAGGYGLLLPGGRVATMTDQVFGGRNELASQRWQVIVRSPEGAAIDTLLDLARPYRSLRFREPQGGLRVGAQPFDDGPLIAVSRDHARFLMVRRPVDSAPRFHVQVWNDVGRIVLRTDVEYNPIRLTPSEVRAAIQLLARSPNPPGELEAEIRRELFTPEHYPPVTSAFFWPDGSIVLRREMIAGRRARYLVLDERGDERFELTSPPHVIPISGNGSTLALFVRDEENGFHYRIVRLPRGG